MLAGCFLSWYRWYGCNRWERYSLQWDLFISIRNRHDIDERTTIVRYFYDNLVKSHASRDSQMSRMRFLTDVLQLFKIVAEVACRRVAKPFNLEGHIFRLNIARHVRSGISFNAMMQSFTGNSYISLQSIRWRCCKMCCINNQLTKLNNSKSPG